MLTRFAFLLLSFIVLIASQTGFVAPALVIPAALGVVFFLILVLRRPSGPAGRSRFGKRKQIIVDGSNVMYWKDGEPRLDSVVEVIINLTRQGFAPGVIFDANVGYLLTGKFKNTNAMAKLLGLPEKRVMVVPKGEPADRFILQAARELGARVVSNDRFRDWVEDFPEIGDPGHVIKGRHQQGDVKLLTDAWE